MSTRTLTRKFVRWIESYIMERHPDSLHVTFGDGNLDVPNIVWDMREAWNSGDLEGAEICRRLLLLDASELELFHDKWWDNTIWNPDDYPED